MVEGRAFPAAVDSERALLGGLLIDPAHVDDVQNLVAPPDFYRREHGELYQLLLEMAASGLPIDVVTVADRIARGGDPQRFGGAAYVVGLPDHAPSTANLGHYAKVVKEKALLREMIRLTHVYAERAHEQPGEVGPLLDEASRDFSALGLGQGTGTWQQISEVVDEEMTRIEKLSEKGGSTSGRSTGFLDLDKLLAGLHPTNLLVLAARPGMGKTALALNIAQNVALMEEVPVGIFSLEMSRGQLVTRMLCCHGMIDAGRVRTGQLTTEDWEHLSDAADFLHKARIHIDDSPNLSIGDLRTRARRLKNQNPDLALLVVDYLQLMRGDDPRAPREQQISSISRGLKILGKELGCAVLALSQLNRAVENRADKRPLMSDLRESGAIEQDADVILFIYRDEKYDPDTLDKGLAEVIVGKQRNGPTGTLKLAFQGQYTRFDNYLEDDVLA